MKNKIEKIRQAEKILKAFQGSIYWLNALIEYKMISKSEAGIIINKGGVK